MVLFTSTYENKLDKKGRVSVPARYRAVLDAAHEPLFITCSLKNPCLEGMPQSRLQRIATTLDGMDMMADKRALLEFILSQAQEMRPDSEGRIVLDDHFIAHANLRDSETVQFVGVGGMFQIWKPSEYQGFAKNSHNRIKGGELPPLRLNGGGQANNGGEG
ncbi:MAG: division/cell wall cluster transcriptional repressor MraZ [Proteobacteria bacterium]|nr:division/cell wall cluster transcriptional repressor MraZ [Pseudomonadota bacterium]